MPYKLEQIVKLTKPGLQGPVRIAGTIIGTNAKGEYIIRTQGDGYFTVSQFQLDQHN